MIDSGLSDSNGEAKPRNEESTTKNANSGNPLENASIRMVIQRYRKANVLIEESKVVTVGEYSMSGSSLLPTPPDCDNDETKKTVGLLAYISFAKSATEQTCIQAAKTILNIPILTLGKWGDKTPTQSVLALSESLEKGKKKNQADGNDSFDSPLSLIIIPQANLTAKVKKNGKSIQYRDQIEKSEGKRLYEFFCTTIASMLLEHQEICRGNVVKDDKNKNQPTTPDPSIEPKDLFRKGYPGTYGAFEEETGFPINLINGDPLTKSAKKRIKKLYDAHVKRHEKYLQKREKEKDLIAPGGDDDKGSNKAIENNPKAQKEQSLDPAFVKLVSGTFGKRQGMELFSDMGPFCHVIEI